MGKSVGKGRGTVIVGQVEGFLSKASAAGHGGTLCCSPRTVRLWQDDEFEASLGHMVRTHLRQVVEYIPLL